MNNVFRLLILGTAIATGCTTYLASLGWATPAVEAVQQSQALPLDQPSTQPLESNSLVIARANPQDPAEWQRIVQYAVKNKLHTRSFSEILQAIAVHYLGTPYEAGLLDRSANEKLVTVLDRFDCVLFIETVLAIARGVAVQDYTHSTFVNHIQDQRYRDGQLNGYCSRLHYFSDWIADNQKRDTVKDWTKTLGGKVISKPLNFMSTHRQSYPQMAVDAIHRCIVTAESRLVGLPRYYIPLNQIRQVYDQLQPGDIVAVATDLKGLDVTHTGLVYRGTNGAIGFIHASPAGAVTIAPDLQTYIRNVDHGIGILLARPLDPRQKVTPPCQQTPCTKNSVYPRPSL